ncbi:hypothetical protein V6N12_045168 [Hibiscus sabdariffa]|uniref:Uncharacterized protein n=1 Tax=Hibiscus sabdariffa TaxID=183260 RepID=A0ABR2G215_9ROSI
MDNESNVNQCIGNQDEVSDANDQRDMSNGQNDPDQFPAYEFTGDSEEMQVETSLCEVDRMHVASLGLSTSVEPLEFVSHQGEARKVRHIAEVVLSLLSPEERLVAKSNLKKKGHGAVLECKGLSSSTKNISSSFAIALAAL